MLKRIAKTINLGLFFFAISLLIVSCVTAKWYNIGTNGTMIEHTVESYNNLSSLDSICAIENIPPIEKWKKLELRDNSTGQKIIQHVYVKQEGNLETVYTIIINADSEQFNLVKRDVR